MRTEYVSRDSGLTKREYYERLASSLKAERTSFDGHYEELSHFLNSRRTRFYPGEKNKGERRNKHIIDTTASMAQRTLKSGMHAGITSPARPWFLLSTPDPDLAEFGPVKQWLYTVTQRMRTVFGQTNLYNALPTVYGDMGQFGTGCMGVFESSTRGLFRCQPYAVGSYWLGVDADGRANTFVRESRKTVWQLIEEFGLPEGSKTIDRSRFSQTVLNLWDRGEDQATVDVVHIIAPNRNADPRRGHAKYYPWASCWFEKGEDKQDRFLRESGFKSFPILAPRWEVTDEDIYGTDCPGMTALGGVKALQIMQKRKAQAVEKLVNPPLQAPSQMAQKRVSVIAGDVTYLDQREAHGGIRPIYEVRPDISAMIESLQDERGLIKEAYFEDLFKLLSSDPRLAQKTAREIDELHEEKVFMLGPMMEHVQDELQKPLVDRAFEMMIAAGLIPEAPEELHGVELKVEWTSILSAALKSSGIAMQDRFVGAMMSMVEAFPDIRHKLNAFQIADTYAEQTGVDPRIIRSDEDAQASLDAERKAMADQAQAEQAQRLGSAAQSLGATPMGGDTALSRLANAAAEDQAA